MSIQCNLFIFVPQRDWEIDAYVFSCLHFSVLVNSNMARISDLPSIYISVDRVKAGIYLFRIIAVYKFAIHFAP